MRPADVLAAIATWIGDTIFYGVGWSIGLEPEDHIILGAVMRGERDPDGAFRTVSRWQAVRAHLLFTAVFFIAYLLYAYLAGATLVAFSGGVDFETVPIA